MSLAVRASGKPAIRLVGDGCVYCPWQNVPVAMTAGVALERLRREKHGTLTRLLRLLIAPIRGILLAHAGAAQGKGTGLVARLLHHIGI